MSTKALASLISAIIAFGFSQAVFAAPGGAESTKSQAQENVKSTTGIFPVRLSATVTHDDEFPPLPSNLHPGSDFKEEDIYAALNTDKDRWYEVPKWLSGEYAYGDMTVYYVENFETKEIDKQTSVIPAVSRGRHRGLLVDKKGNIWALCRGGRVPSANNPNQKTYFRYDDETIGYLMSPTQYNESSESIEVRVNDAGKIIKITRMQRSRDFTLTKDGKIDVDIHETHYGLDGHPITADKAKGTMHKIEDFAPMTVAKEGKDDYNKYVESLRKHLAAVNKADDSPELSE